MVGPLLGFIGKRAVEFAGGHLMGLGYTSGAYTGYGISNTADPFGIHQNRYKHQKIKIDQDMFYGRRSYFRRRYRPRYRRYSRFSRYRRRRSYYSRRYY